MSAVVDLEPQTNLPPMKRGGPSWNVALLFPPQGEWTEQDYLALEGTSGNRLLELVDGCLEVLPMPDVFHQRIVRYLYRRLDNHVRHGKLGEAFFAPLPMKLRERRLREPDIVFLRPGRIVDPWNPPQGAELVMEVVSPGEENRERDLQTKRVEYARAGISEYWIVDQPLTTITILVLDGQTFREHMVGKPRSEVESAVLAGFRVGVDDTFAAGNAED
jgi:Uma2 family endonuclease